MQCCEHFARAFASFRKSSLPKHMRTQQNPTAAPLQPGWLGGWGEPGCAACFRARRAPLGWGAGYRLLSSRGGIYQQAADARAVPRGRRVKSAVMGAGAHPALLPPPCQAQRKCHPGGTPGKGAVQHPGMGRGHEQAGAEQLCPLRGLRTRGSRFCRQKSTLLWPVWG